MSRLALLGGTFDPIHCGHLDIARAAREALGVREVLLVPSHVPPHRRKPVASAVHRFAMAALAAQDDPGLLVSDIEMEDAAPSYTSSTLAKLAARGFKGTDVCFGPVLNMAEAPNHPHNVARKAFLEIDGVTQPAPAPRFSRTPGEVQGPPAKVGAHTEEVLAAWNIEARPS